MIAINSTILACAFVAVMHSSAVTAFAPTHAFITSKHHQQQQQQPLAAAFVQTATVTATAIATDTSNIEDAAQQQLQKAKMLRQQAEQASIDLKSQRLQKKMQQDRSTDELIETYFFGIDRYTDSCSPDDALLNRLRDRRVGVSTLLQMVDRIFEREILANNNDENMLDGCIEALIELHEVLDEEFNLQQHCTACVAHSVEEHYGAGNVSHKLQNRFQQLQRQTQVETETAATNSSTAGASDRHHDIAQTSTVSVPVTRATPF
mmetsp:Transcript_20847/g.57963  ORF Transcript_20847/g.57963 Transcript_20847/m.57963 type:complete len:263 (-) Transcript_20847:164-952(-)|eukprot:CAMPEP_0198127620 /NCGR_PEP_ID=MMETSP1442-20131203/47589_1 /TAXON_ID= /ORGANISM="Craspedostauros australis, Strain CCMP3328" /LENGTH=262 /DNA_ID=CAMNT_0043787625 /DNA_START=75 /DNA_END=863 /DNA_ORIENTATION=+